MMVMECVGACVFTRLSGPMSRAIRAIRVIRVIWVIYLGYLFG